MRLPHQIGHLGFIRIIHRKQFQFRLIVRFGQGDITTVLAIGALSPFASRLIGGLNLFFARFAVKADGHNLTLVNKGFLGVS
jgi:hypothetical protein